MEKQQLSRRNLFRHACCSGLGALAAVQAPMAFAADAKKTTVTADQALQMLKEGNRKFLEEGAGRVVTDRQRRLDIARGQQPFAILVSCSDSRVPPELLFGRGLGELFIIRNAGNTVDTVALGSIEYAVHVLGVPLVLVMGHERCGAVDAAVGVVEKNATYPGSLGQMIEPIIPAVLQARAKNVGAKGDELLDASVVENVRRVVGRLRQSEAILSDVVRSGKVKIVGARYDLDDGRVEFFEG